MLDVVTRDDVAARHMVKGTAAGQCCWLACMIAAAIVIGIVSVHTHVRYQGNVDWKRTVWPDDVMMEIVVTQMCGQLRARAARLDFTPKPIKSRGNKGTRCLGLHDRRSAVEAR